MMKILRFIPIAVLVTLLLLAMGLSTVYSPARAQTAPPKPPVAILKLVGIPANPADKNAITAKIKIITDTAKGETESTVAMGTTGTTNQPINVPVHLAVQAADSKNIGKATWTLPSLLARRPRSTPRMP